MRACALMCVSAHFVLYFAILLILQELRAWSLQKVFNMTVAMCIIFVVIVYGISPTSRTLRASHGSLKWYYTTRDTAKPSNLSIFLESSRDLAQFYSDAFIRANMDNCTLPNHARCIYQSVEPMADVVFRAVQFIRPNGNPLRYCPNQVVAVLNSEADKSIHQFGLDQMDLADIRIDHHPTSDAMFAEICSLPIDRWDNDHSHSDASKRKGIALFLSDCSFQWRTRYIRELMRYVNIDSYGRCFHNTQEPSSRENGYSMVDIASTYRMVVTFENTIQTDYITEKIVLVYLSGAIPVYWGPPEIYSWVPGNHSFIDASKFSGPQELAAYLKSVEESDELFRHHTTNFDVERSRAASDKYCYKSDYFCRVCQLGYDKVAKHMENAIVAFRPAHELHRNNPCTLHYL